MKLVSWNVRGLNSPAKHRMIKKMIQQDRPSIIYLQETKCSSTVLEKILNKAWPRCKLVLVDASGASGGLAIIWNPKELYLQDFHASHFFIQSTFHIIGTNSHGHLSNVYFPQELQKKLDMLETISELNANKCFPFWICGGDFNIITSLEEKSGGRQRMDEDSYSLKDFIHRNQLMDL